MYTFIANPNARSGRGILLWKQIEKILLEKEIAYNVLFTKYQHHATRLVHDLTSDGTPHTIVVLGGDGTLNEVIDGIRYLDKVTLGYIPLGSGNDFARGLGLPTDIHSALEQILSPSHYTAMNVGVLDYENKHRRIAVSTGIGFDAAVCEEALSSPIKDVLNKLKLGKLTYLGIALKQLIQAKSIACDLILDNKTQIHLNRFLFVASMLHQYEGGGFKFCPAANATDGILDLCVVGKLPKPFILFALPTAFWGKHYVFPNITHYSAHEIELHTSAPLWVHTDGEVHQKANHIKISCRKQTIRFLF